MNTPKTEYEQTQVAVRKIVTRISPEYEAFCIRIDKIVSRYQEMGRFDGGKVSKKDGAE